VIALVDYGAGNLTSVRKALSAVGMTFQTPSAPRELAGAAGIIVPGVGHFAATLRLDDAWRATILERVERGVPLLGVCVGMQWLFEGSEEAPDVAGLGLLKGRCVRLSSHPPSPGVGSLSDSTSQHWPGAASRLKVPHVGWNSLIPPRPSRLLEGVAPASQVYFTHSYAAPVTADCVAVTTHGTPFAAAVERNGRRDRIFGVQFHPEKSGDTGLRIIRNFLDVVEANHRLP
jgi:imidazole glycerol-phosphate synthase subunit HisH